MAGEAAIGPAGPPTARGKSAWRWPQRVAIAVLVAALLAVLAGLLLDTSPGRRFLAGQLAEREFANGLRVEIGEIDGSIYGASVLHDVKLYDTQRVFFTSPQVRLDWRPLQWLHNRLDIRVLDIRSGRLLAVPVLRRTGDDSPILPGFDILLGQLTAHGLVIEKPVAGRREIANVDASATIRSGMAKVDLLAALVEGDDRVRILLDAVPERNRLAASIDVNAPKGGVIAALAGLNDSFRARVTGKGAWDDWAGALRIDSGETLLARSGITVRSGETELRGTIYPQTLVSGLPQRLLGREVSIAARGSLDARVLRGRLDVRGTRIVAAGKGAIDLGGNAFENFRLNARIGDPGILGGDVRLNNPVMSAVLDGRFRDLLIDYTLRADSAVSPDFAIAKPVATGKARWNGSRALVPVRLTSAGIRHDDPLVSRLLQGLAINGDLIWQRGRLSSDSIKVAAQGVRADLSLAAAAPRGAYALEGSALFPALAFANVGNADVSSKLRFVFGGGAPWTLRGSLAARMRRVENRTVTSVLGDNIRFVSSYSFGKNLPLLLDNMRIDASRLTASGNGRRLADGNILLAASGRHTQYGPFKLAFEGQLDTAKVQLTLDDPYPPLGLRDVTLALSPISDGFAVEAEGGSALGPFGGLARIFARPGGATLIRIASLKISRTVLTGDLTANGTAISGNLAASGGGIDGTLRVSPQGAGQRIIANLTARDARFDADVPITVARGSLTVNAVLVTGRSDIDATLNAQGIGSGNLFIGKVAANARLVNGAGRVTASFAGRRGSRFDLQTAANIAPRSVRFTASGNYGRRRIVMPANGLARRLEGGGWQLSPARINIGGGAAVVSGRFGGGLTDAKFQITKMPLALADIGAADLGLGGEASGLVTYRQARGQIPTGTAKLQVRQLTRSGLALTSRPVDLAVNAALGANALALRGVMQDRGNILGRFQARVSSLPQMGSLVDRLRRGNLFGQVRYAGPVDAIWRLIKVEEFDLTGPISIAADATGSLADPQIRGAISTDNVRLESALSGTVVEKIRARGRFAGSVLTLTGFNGQVAGGGSVAGSGTVDLGIANGPGIDIVMQAKNAQLLNRDDIAATVNGRLTVVSTGPGGTLGGNVTISRGRFRLGNSDLENKLPNLAYREINLRADELPPGKAKVPWRYDLTATADNRLFVTGLGIDSEWRADLKLRGEIDSPRIDGIARLVRGTYEFAGRRFDLERGQVTFRGASPPDPQLDVVALANVQGLSATINVKGTGQRPEITFNSVPALPEEELLSRLLFGSSINDISAPEAVQLASAVASLRTGGGLDPINQLRSAIGLDRLRIIGADAATGQKTSVAAGKYIGRRTYVEVITDGRGYSATQVEFQITRWLSILSSISTLGRQSANVRVSKDY